MKRFLLAASLALGLAFSSQQQAQAWTNSRLSFGFNWTFQTGGHSLFFGISSCGQPPGHCQISPWGYHGSAHGYAAAPYYYVTAPQTITQPPATSGQYDVNTSNGASSYQPIGAFTGAYYGSGTGAYYPSYSGYYQTPSYWYGR